MGFLMEEYKKVRPFLKTECSAAQGGNYCERQIWTNENATEQYQDKVSQFALECGLKLQKQEGLKMILLTEDTGIAKKLAAMLSSERYRALETESEYDEEEDEDDWGIDYYDDEDFDAEDMWYQVQLGILNLAKEHDSTNTNNRNLDDVLVLNSMQIQNCLAIGVNTDDLTESKYEALAAAPQFFKNFYVMLPTKSASSKLVSRLKGVYDFQVLEVPKVLEESYGDTFDMLKAQMEQAGVSFDDVDKEMTLKKIRRALGAEFSEEAVVRVFDYAYQSVLQAGKNIITQKDILGEKCTEKTALEALYEMTGLEEVKQKAEEFMALSIERKRNPALKLGNQSMVFIGNPGTGKTTCGEIMSDIINETGIGNGSFVTAASKDLIGRYVGQTAPKIAEKFREAREGVLFIDEAGMFLNNSEFTREAIKELVRYMEQCPDVTVIFAMYPKEAKAFLKLDQGLSSRIGRILRFKDYTDEELVAIARSMIEKQGYSMQPKSDEIIRTYIRLRRVELQESFGNAREIRKLVQEGISACALRHFKEQDKKWNNKLLLKDLKAASEKLCAEQVVSNQGFGFYQGNGRKEIIQYGN